MLKTLLVVSLVMFIGLGCEVVGQNAGRANELAAALDKTKYKKKEKANISIEFYLDIKNEAAVREPSEYTGTYYCENEEYRMTLNVDRSGAVSGSGYDTSPNGDARVNFTLKDASITGALLTGTKVYDNGQQKRLEAVFVNRTTSTGKNVNTIESRDTKFGLGFIEEGNWSDNKGNNTNWTSRVFLERR